MVLGVKLSALSAVGWLLDRLCAHVICVALALVAVSSHHVHCTVAVFWYAAHASRNFAAYVFHAARTWLCSTRVLHSVRVCCRRRATFLICVSADTWFRVGGREPQGEAGVALLLARPLVTCTRTCVRGRGGCSRSTDVEISGARTGGEPSGVHRDRRAEALDIAGSRGCWAWSCRHSRSFRGDSRRGSSPNLG